MTARTPHRILLAAATLAMLVACLDLPVAPEAEVTALGGVRCAPDDAFEENDTPASATAVSVGTLRAVTCRTPGDTAEDVDFYALRGTADSGYRAWLDASPLAVGKELRLFDAVSGDPVVTEVDGNLRMPKSGRLLAVVRLCCVKAGDSLPYALLLSDRPNHAPVAAFDWSPERPVIGGPVTLTSTAADPDGDSLIVRRWTLGDGRSATGATLETSWPARGRYTITHIVADPWGRGDTLSREITVDPDVARIDVSPASAELAAINDTLVLAAVARDPAGAVVPDVDFTWLTSDSAVATVTSSGAVVARANGTAQVSAAAFGRRGAVTVTVRQKVARVVLTPSSLNFGALGRTVTIVPRVEDARGSVVAGIAPAWRSSDEDIAAVNASGAVTAVARGTATITASVPASRGTVSGGTVSAQVAVTVTQVPAQVRVTPSTATLSAATDSVLLGAAAADSGGTVIAGLPVAWSTTDLAVATVGADGWVRPVGNGTATITATIGGVAGTAAITVALPSGGPPPGAPFAVIASPDTALIPAPWTAEPILRARVVDAVGTTVPGQTFTWNIITPAFSYGLSPVGAASNDSVKVTLPYWGASGRQLFKVEVTSGTLADTLTVFQVAPRQWQSLAAGRAHTCGVSYNDYGSSNYEVYCWGDNSRGQLGLPASVTDSPVPVRMPSDTVGISTLVAGDDFTCAVAGGAVYCWGSNEFGQLGAVTTDNCAGVDCSREAVRAGSVAARHLSAGPEHVCSGVPQIFFGGFSTPPQIDCWGRNQHGQIGRDPLLTPFSSTPAALPSMPITGGITGVAAFGGTSCYVISGLRRCIGLNSAGEYGMNTTAGSYIASTSPVGTAILVDEVLNGGIGFLCGFPRITPDLIYGKISCWGTDASGQLGLAAGYTRQACGGAPCVINATVNPLPQPQYSGASINGASGWWDVGAAHVCAKTDTDFTCWGDNAGGQLGDGTRTARSVPTAITLPTGTINKVTAGVAHTCVDINGAGLHCWGTGGNGRLGDNARVDRLTPVRVVDP